MKPHKHTDLIKAWADGAEIQLKDEKGNWVEATPDWDVTIEYRVKPEPKPDFVTYIFTDRHDDEHPLQHNSMKLKWNLKIKITWDGETDKPKSVELVK